jgi:hypothetical protein
MRIAHLLPAELNLLIMSGRNGFHGNFAENEIPTITISASTGGFST